MIAPNVKKSQEIQRIRNLNRGTIEGCAFDRVHWIEATSFECTVTVDILSESEESFVAKRKKRAAQCSEDL